jgi:phosphoglycolate phosphatase
VARKRLVLFDIDGTLLSAGGASARSISRAMQEVYGDFAHPANFEYAGKTDPQICTEVMASNGWHVAEIERHFDVVFERYVRYLSEALPQSPTARIFPGVRSLLERLAGNPDVCVGLLTGNIEATAWIKLRHFSLDHFFQVGAFGSDAKSRYALPPVAVERATRLVTHSWIGKEVVIVGDTHHDILCGRDYGVKAIAVATGIYDRAFLQQHEPDYLFDDLSHVDHVHEAILA